MNVNIDPLLDEVRLSLKNNEFDLAYFKAIQICREYPTEQKSWLCLCTVERHRGNLSASLDALNNAPKKDFQWMANRAQIANLMHDWETGYLFSEKALEQNPNIEILWMIKAESLSKQKKYHDALFELEKAIEINQNSPLLYIDAGEYARIIGELNQARIYLTKAIELNPNITAAWVNLGLVLDELGDFDKAEEAHRSALKIDSSTPAAYNGLASIASAKRDWLMAREYLLEALKLDPNQVDYKLNLTAIYGILCDFEKAFECLINTQLAESNKLTYLKVKAQLELYSKNWSKALSLAKEILAGSPNFWQVHLIASRAAFELSQAELADIHVNYAIKAAPRKIEPLLLKAKFKRDAGQLSEAESLCQQSLEIFPTGAGYESLASTLLYAGFGEMALEAYEEALKRLKNPDTISSVLYAMAYSGIGDPNKIKKLAQEWDELVLTKSEKKLLEEKYFTRKTAKNRTLVIGYISGDFRDHVIRYFISPLIAGHDREKTKVILYETSGIEDGYSETLRNQADSWRSIANLSDEAVMKIIEEDRIDILIDLSGHTDHHRLKLFAKKAAPVQLTYLGFPATTGIAVMDGFIGDSILMPQFMEKFFVEKIIRLDRVWLAYDPPAQSPDINWEQDQTGVIRLGCFNKLAKINLSTLNLWVELLHLIPNSEIIIKDRSCDDEKARGRFISFFKKNNISETRVKLFGKNITPDWVDHMNFYNRIDIVLDPIGGTTGGTTTCEALWMGQPVITLAGNRPGSRMSASIISAAGNEQWIAHDEQSYKLKVIELSNFLPSQSIRVANRKRMHLSKLCDGKDLASVMESTFLSIFEDKINSGLIKTAS
jgi:protein O-GlcNAc transferase